VRQRDNSLESDVDAEVAPRKLVGVRLTQHLDRTISNVNRSIGYLHFAGKWTVYRIVAQQVRIGADRSPTSRTRAWRHNGHD